ncbi:MAG: RNA polymerase factor sigma-54 [Planctomycetota bacterium]
MTLQPGLGLMQKLQMRQEMVMTPQMIQSMQMLQLPLLTLEQRVQQELLENPALETEESAAEEEEEASLPAAGAEEPDGADDGDIRVIEAGLANSLIAVDQSDNVWEETLEDHAPRRRLQGDEDPKQEAHANAPARAPSLSQALIDQLVFLHLSGRERALVERILYSLDAAGYLRVPLAELADPEDPEPPTGEEWSRALSIVQGLDPPGVGARDLRESLLLQLQALPGAHEFERELVERHLDDLAANRLPKIARAMDCRLEDIKAAIEVLHGLNPHPGFEFGPDANVRVVPDVSVRFEEGRFHLLLNRGNVPALSISAACQAAARSSETDAETRRYLRERILNADWIVRAIEQRHRTLLNVTRAIVHHQREFLLGSAERPGPLMMQTVADEVKIDISTVSRAVREKYADTPRGLVALRDLFTRAVGGEASSPGPSNVQVMNRIREIIDAEDKARPLKDAQIVNLLKAEGVEIVRRTVAKYRQNLGLPSQSRRREY